MPYLKYYTTEQQAPELKQARETRLTDGETAYIFERLKSKYGLIHALKFWGNDKGGNCSMNEIKLTHNPPVLFLAHEIAHGIQYKKKRAGKIIKRFHSKAHARSTKRISDFILTNLPEWRANLDRWEAERAERNTFRKEKTEQTEAFKLSPAGKIQAIDRQVKKWESKRNRADNALKKLGRKRKIWEKKLRVKGETGQKIEGMEAQEAPEAIGTEVKTCPIFTQGGHTAPHANK